jgi:ABC-type glycerol-3-phosphate transport system substrate-binding protein
MNAPQVLARRRLLELAVFGAAGPALLAACGGAPAAKPTEPPKPATVDAKAPEPAAKAIPPTPTSIPLFTPVPQAQGTTRVLVRVHWGGRSFNYFQTILNAYNETQGPQDKTFMALERTVGGLTAFIADFQAGTQEDVYHLSDAYLADLSARGFFTPAPKEIQAYIKENYLPSAVTTGTIDGQIMGHPTENQPHMLFLNKRMFQAAGLDAEKSPPKTWDDIRRMAKQLTVKDAAGAKTQAGYIVHLNNGERAMVQRLLFQHLAGAPLVDAKATPPKWDVTSEAARQFTEHIYNTAVVDGSGSADMGPPNIIWGQRKGAMISQDAFAVTFQVIAEGMPGLIDEQHTIPLMSPDGSKTGNLSRNYHFTVSSKSKHQELAWKHLVWLNHGPEFRMQDFMTNTFGFVASVKSYPMPKPFPEQMKQAFTASLTTPHQTATPVIKGLAEVLNIFRDNYDALVFGKATPKEHTEKLDAELTKAMQDAYAK